MSQQGKPPELVVKELQSEQKEFTTLTKSSSKLVQLGDWISETISNLMFGFWDFLLFVTSAALCFTEALHLASLFPPGINPFWRILAVTLFEFVLTVAIGKIINEVEYIKVNADGSWKDKDGKYKYGWDWYAFFRALLAIGAIIMIDIFIMYISYSAVQNEPKMILLGYHGDEDSILTLSWVLVLCQTAIDVILAINGLIKTNQHQNLIKLDKYYKDKIADSNEKIKSSHENKQKGADPKQSQNGGNNNGGGNQNTAGNQHGNKVPPKKTPGNVNNQNNHNKNQKKKPNRSKN